MARNRAGGTRQSALNIGVLDRVRRFQGSLSVDSDAARQLNAFYRFRLNSTSDVTLTLTGLRGNADIWLTGGDGGNEAIGRSRRQGRRDERITRRGLAAGTYFIQVGLEGARTPYTLTASPTATPPDQGGGGGGGGGGGDNFPAPVTPPTDPGRVLNLAFNLGTLSGRSAYSGVVRNSVNEAGTNADSAGGPDTIDYYRFDIARSSEVTISTVNVSGGAVQTQLIYDINGDTFVDQNDVLGTGDNLTKGLGAGTYFVGVSRLSGENVNYVLRLSERATGISPSDPPLGLIGEGGSALSLADATLIGTLGGVQQQVSTSNRNNPALVGTFDSTDIYKFVLTDEVSSFSALLTKTAFSGNVTMSLIYDENGNGIANPGELVNGFVVLGDFPGGGFTGGSEGGAAIPINKILGRGTYYLAVTQRNVTDNAIYNIDLFSSRIDLPVTTISGTLPAIPDPGDSMRTAYQVPFGVSGAPLNTNISYRQFVGSVDGSDFYTFTLDQPRNIIIRYSGTPEPVGIRFGTDYNGNGFFDPFEDVNNNRILDPGEDLNGNGVLDKAEDLNGDGLLNPGEDFNGNGILDQAEDKNNNGRLDGSEDINGNGVLDRDVFQPSLIGNVVYSPLPPFFNNLAEFNSTLDTFLTPGISTDIYARLPAGTYFVEINSQAINEADLGDGLTRYGSANVLYNLSFILEPPVA